MRVLSVGYRRPAMEDRTYYVYLYRCPRGGHPVYVGKGKGRRATSHLRGSSNRSFAAWLTRTPGVEPEIVGDLMSESEAFALEATLVAQFGRLSEGGSLFNALPGGGEPPAWIDRAPVWTDTCLKLHEVAHVAGISVSTLKRCSRRGEIKIIRLSSRRLGVRKSELARWLSAAAQ